LAGTGKSTIARTIASEYSKLGRLGASFFFSRGGGDVGHAGKFVTTVAVQLANNIPPLKHGICDAFKNRSDITSQPLQDQWRQLVLLPLSKLDGSSSLSSYILVVDALDECDNDKHISMILRLLAEAQSLKTVRLRVFLTSRPEIPIRSGFYRIPRAEHLDFILHHISPATVDHDLSIFLEHNFEDIRQRCALDARWPGEHAIEQLVQNACGLFIWAATACRFISEGKKEQVIKTRLSSILQSNGSMTKPEKHLDEIYITVLRNAISADYSSEEEQEVCSILRHMLGSIVILLSPLSIDSLRRLLHVQKQEIDETLEDLHAILDIPMDQARPLRLHHPSFRDFLLNKDRCTDSNLHLDEHQAHRALADSCLRLMSNSLKQDICDMGAPGVLAANMENCRVEKYLPLELQYACLYWIQHLRKSSVQLYDNDQFHQFLQVHFLHWLEALGWMQKISEGIHAIASLESIAIVSRLPASHKVFS